MKPVPWLPFNVESCCKIKAEIKTKLGKIITFVMR